MGDLNTIGGIHYEMMRRCYNPKSVAYKDYGAKGITVCEEWHNRDNFRAWAMNNNYKKGERLERINSKLQYCPSNCRFGNHYTKSENATVRQQRNIRLVHKHKIMREFDIDTNYTETRLYGIYYGMRSRCENKNASAYKYYGGRNIRVCDKWTGKDGFFEFYKWAYQNGYKDYLSIDRVDNDKNYSPNNCRWVDSETQMNNRRNSRRFSYKGNMETIRYIANDIGISYSRLYGKLVTKGMSIDDIVEEIHNIK